MNALQNPAVVIAIRVLEAEAHAIRCLVDRMGESFLHDLDIAEAWTGKVA